MKQVISCLMLGIFLGGLSLAYAGGNSSGGGNVVVCFDSPSIVEKIHKQQDESIYPEDLSHITSIEAYDLHEALLKRGFERRVPKIVSLREGESFQDYIDRIKGRLDVTVPILGGMLEQSKRIFNQEHILFHDQGVVRVDDMNAVGTIDKINCVLATAAVQEKVKDQFFLNIDERLFFHEKHSELSRAILLLHEYFYRVAREFGQEDSQTTRKLIREVISNEPDTKLYSVVQNARTLGFLRGDFSSYGIEFGMLGYPVYLLWNIVNWNLRMAAYNYYSNTGHNGFDSQRPSDLPSSHDLITKSYEIFISLYDQFHMADQRRTVSFFSVEQALAYLKQQESNFRLYKNPVEAQKTLEDLKRYLSLRKEGLERYLNTGKGSWQNKILAIIYLTENQKTQIVKALDYMIQKLVDLSGVSLTNEEIERLNGPLPPGLISFGPKGIYTLEDLSPYVDIGDLEKTRKRIENIKRWLNGSIELALIMEGFDYSGISFPVLE